MVNKNSYFYISGLISISLFTFFVSIIIFMMLSTSKNDIFALKKDQFISISLEVPKLKTSNKNIIASEASKNNIEKPKDVNIDDLFSDVWTKNIKKQKTIKKNVNTRRLLEIQKKSKTVDENSNKSNLDKTDIDESSNKADEINRASTANVVNEYLAKIQALVYQKFSPPLNSQGYSVKAIIELSAIGKVMDFRILNYSANSNLNNECDKIKAKLTGVLFPANPENKSFSVIINLIPENKERI